MLLRRALHMLEVQPMKKIIVVVIGGLFAAGVASFGHAQTAPSDGACSDAQANFDSAMQVFRSAYFQRRDAVGSAESVMEDEVFPSANQIYQSCSAETVTAYKNIVERVNASLLDPRRGQLVACDRALIDYQSLLGRYDHQNLPSYSEYRNLLHHEIDPAAERAIDACPQMPDLAQQTRSEIIERQARLDRMEDIDNQGPSYFDTRENINAYNEAYEEAYSE